MKYFEYGKENRKLVVMLHGGGVSYQGAEPTVKTVARKYHVVLAAYDGFNPSPSGTKSLWSLDTEDWQGNSRRDF